MTQTAMRGIGELRALMDGPVITPADRGVQIDWAYPKYSWSSL